MDRAAKLAAEARDLLRREEEAWRVSPVARRAVTRSLLAGIAAQLGFAPNEISAAVDQALTDAGTIP